MEKHWYLNTPFCTVISLNISCAVRYPGWQFGFNLRYTRAAQCSIAWREASSLVRELWVMAAVILHPWQTERGELLSHCRAYVAPNWWNENLETRPFRLKLFFTSERFVCRLAKPNHYLLMLSNLKLSQIKLKNSVYTSQETQLLHNNANCGGKK
jgi:hypothetical protein